MQPNSNPNLEHYKDREIQNGVTVRQLQNHFKEMLVYFIDICEKNNLTWWCGGGTMLGAIRHGGFIPWDDDIDIFMPREDYDRLYEIWNDVADTSRYVLCKTDESHNYHHTVMNLTDIHTTYINRHSAHEDIIHGAYIDINPYEGCPDGKFAQMIQVYHSILYSIFNVQRLPDHQGKLLRFATSIVLNAVKDPKKRTRVWQKHEKKMTKYPFHTARYVKETVTSFRALFWPFPREMFDTIEVPFEDITIKIPAGYDAYMKKIYGDYMQLPPEEGRVAKHSLVYVSLTEPYTKFKGIHYCVENGK